MSATRVLVVDDEEGMLEVCRDTLQKLPETEILLEKRASRAAERVVHESIDLLIADICMPDLDGVELLRMARHHDPNLAALMLTAYPSVDTAVASMKLGATDYLTKPCDPDQLLATVRPLLEGKRLREENRLLRRQVERAYAFGEMIGNSTPMQQVLKTIGKIAPTDLDVLIFGETGTGKELAARAIHYQSPRCEKPFVPVDCGAIPGELMESEFFGHERGAFTGAQSRSRGLLEFAQGGTVFLDEIGQLPLQLQAKLLRALQERKIRRVGSTHEIDVDVRILAATSLNLEQEQRQERFRKDLYHRIYVATIDLPPLRERSQDVPLLVDHFLDRYSREMERGRVAISSDASEVLRGYPWPGNVRELQNLLKRMVAMAEADTITIDDLPERVVIQASQPQGKDEGSFFQLRDQRVAAFEKEYLKNLLESCHGDVSRAAREAELPRGTFYRLLNKYSIDPAIFRD